MKRSNRLVLLVGVFLAIVAFVGILLLSRGDQSKPPPVITTAKVIVASADIPLSTRIRADQLTTKEVDLGAVSAGAYGDVSQVVGQIARQPIATGAQITPTTLGAVGSGGITNIDCPATFRCMAVQVDQLTGVGTVIKTGDYVDMIIGLQGDQFPVITTNPTDGSITVVAGVNGTSVKTPLLLQGLQVVGTLLPPVAAPAAAPAASGAPAATGAPTTTLSGQQEIVVIAVSPQQDEVIRFAQLSGAAPLGAISLVLRSANDFIDPTTGAIVVPPPVQTTGIILKTLVDSYGILPPEVIETVTPTATRKP